MSKQTWKELYAWHGEGEYGGERRCPRCGRRITKKIFSIGEAMDDIFIIETTCPRCGLEYAMVCQRDDIPDEGVCDECGAYDWAGADSYVKWPYAYYTSSCYQCGNTTTVDTDFQFIMNVVRESERGESGFEIVGIDEACDLVDACD